MNKIVTRFLVFSLLLIFSIVAASAHADTNETPVTSISLDPSSQTVQISANSVYDKSFKFKNAGDSQIKIEVYAAPYLYTYSEASGNYELGFSNQNNFTQISRWVSIQDQNGNYVEKPVFMVDPNQVIEINYRIVTPDNIPAGSQYAVIFAHTVSDSVSTAGIRTEASAGMILYGRSTEGETIVSPEISDLAIMQGTQERNSHKNNIYATAKVKNSGNIDFTVTGQLKIEPIIGTGSYETAGSASLIIPESERVIIDEWQDTPDFGVYKATWTVSVGDLTKTIERTIFVVPVWIIILSIILLTIIVIWIIIGVRKRKARRARLAI